MTMSSHHTPSTPPFKFNTKDKDDPGTHTNEHRLAAAQARRDGQPSRPPARVGRWRPHASAAHTPWPAPMRRRCAARQRSAGS
eukprot:4475812-Prymnesium_polylepis.2